jgi:hypothetical protein
MVLELFVNFLLIFNYTLLMILFLLGISKLYSIISIRRFKHKIKKKSGIELEGLIEEYKESIS